MASEHLVLYRKHSTCKYAPMPSFFQIEEAWIHWWIWNPSPSVGLRKTVWWLSFMCPFLSSFPALASPSNCLWHSQLLFCRCAWQIWRQGWAFFLFFLSFVVPLSLMLLFPLGRGWSLLSCSCSKKRCQVNLLVPPATVAARCFARRRQLSYKGFFTKQGLCACHCSPELFIPELRSWFLTHTVFMGGCGATCCKYILCQLILLYFSSSSTKDTKLSQEINLKL